MISGDNPLLKITAFNIKEDFDEYTFRYVAVALLAMALIALSTQMHQIGALKGINSPIILGVGCGLLGLELLTLLYRNMTTFHRISELKVHTTMHDDQYLKYIDHRGKEMYYTLNDQSKQHYSSNEKPQYKNEIPHAIVVQSLKIFGERVEDAPPVPSDKMEAYQKLIVFGNKDWCFRCEIDNKLQWVTHDQILDEKPNGYQEISSSELTVRYKNARLRGMF